MLGLQGNASSKVYQCGACPASFCGLASLLVHQATHAGSLPKPGTNPVPSTPMYICDCGEEFSNFSVMMEHKRSHVSEEQETQKSHNNEVNTLSDSTVAPTEKDDGEKAPAAVVAAANANAAVGPSVRELPPSKNTGENADKREFAVQGNDTKDHSPASAEAGQLTERALAVEEEPEEGEGNQIDEPKPKSKLMAILASAYGKHISPKSLSEGDGKIKEEPEPVAIATQLKELSTVTDSPLKRLLRKSGTKTKAPSIGKLLEFSTKKIVSLTKIFSPVVLLETRNKFMDPSTNLYGKYLCGRCRRVFQDADSLTEHHFLHKKERIKCCRCCKQLIIGRVPLPDNHFCPLAKGKTTGKATTPSHSSKGIASDGQKTVHINHWNNRKKVYFCPICKHNYARRYNLKMHKCRGPLLSPPPQRSNNEAEAHLDVSVEGNSSQSVGVGTKSIKVEDTSEQEYENELSNMSWSSASSLKEQHLNASAFVSSFLHEQNSNWSGASDKDEGNQWTMPLNDIDLFPPPNTDTNARVSDAAFVSNSNPRPRHVIKDGVKRHFCHNCQRAFSTSCSLSRHKNLCCNNGLGGVPNSTGLFINANNVKMYSCYVCGRNFNRKDNMMTHRKKCETRRTMIPNNVREINPSLPPPPAPLALSKAPPQPPVEQQQKQQQQKQQQQKQQQQKQQQQHHHQLLQEEEGEEDAGSWSIMSLPSVLPRRVTCECGMSFTSPKLLLEHLQKHAQESYTCPTCGVTVNSWADYEIHLQLHMHPQHHKRPQPLLLRIKQHTAVQPRSQPVLHNLPKAPIVINVPHVPIAPNVPLESAKPLNRPEQPRRPKRKTQRTVCSKCGKSFASRCSLRRHISWNRCKALRMASSNKTYHCPLCNTDFPNAISLLFHQRGGTCKPAIKPVRCPICLRWFTTTDGLQKHLLAHKNSETFRCDVCQGTYPSLKSLKIHRRRIHRIMVRSGPPDANELAFPGSVSVLHDQLI